jgi:hypothetical protein
MRSGCATSRFYLLVGAVTAVAVGGGIAYAYWTSTSAGNGTGTTGTSTTFVVGSSTATGGPLTPGGPVRASPSPSPTRAPAARTLSSVVVTVANADGSAWTSVTGCFLLDYTVGTPVVTYGQIASLGVVSGTVTLR